jgi:Xaa-Pro aminopeptidase
MIQSKRLHHLVDLMEEENLDCSIVTDPRNVYYFTGIAPQSILSLVYSFSTLSCLLVFRDGKSVLLTSQREAKTAKEVFDGEIVTFVNYDLRERMIAYPDFVATQLKKLISGRSLRFRRIGVESWHIPHVLLDTFNQTEFYDLSSNILRWRTVKDSDELLAIRKCCELNDYAYSIAKSVSISGRSEIEVYAIILGELTKNVGSYQFFAGDIVSGERSLEGGGLPTARRLNDGETFILDLWMTWKGYWTDTCRTFVIGGKPTPSQKQTLELLKEAMAAGEEKLRPGVKSSEVYSAVFNVISAAGLGTRFPHHAGHGIGLDDQEPPFFIPASNDVLAEGMTCTLEPGVYVPGVGGFRIEHNYLITGNKPERLTSYPLDL